MRPHPSAHNDPGDNPCIGHTFGHWLWACTPDDEQKWQAQHRAQRAHAADYEQQARLWGKKAAHRQAQPDEPYRWVRLARLHSVQVVLDTLAHIQNVPLRIFRRDALRELPDTVRELCSGPQYASHVDAILRDGGIDADELRLVQQNFHTRDRSLESKMLALRDWILHLADAEKVADVKPPPDELFLRVMLILLPHIEQRIWLTEMANPLPVHAIARMADPWALFVLMWSWSQHQALCGDANGTATLDAAEPQHGNPQLCEFAQDQSTSHDALGCSGWRLWVSPAFCRQSLKDNDLQTLGLIIGPLRVEAPCQPQAEHEAYKDPYLKRIKRLNDNWIAAGRKLAEQRAKGKGLGEGIVSAIWREAQEKCPTQAELWDARNTRGTLLQDEAAARARRCWEAWQRVMSLELDAPQRAHEFSRANVETLSLLVAWLSRWHELFKLTWGSAPPIAVQQHAVWLEVCVDDVCLDGQSDKSWPSIRIRKERDDFSAQHAQRRQQDLKAWVEKACKQWRWIEMPEVMLSRMRERQTVGSTAQVMAINNLLLRHSRSDVRWPGDEPNHDLGDGPDAADHLLRGFGGRVCRHLVSMTRADMAFVYWLDYSQVRPVLISAGSHMRLIQHHAKRQAISRDFRKDLWKPEAPLPTADKGWLSSAMQKSQLYRVAATGTLEHYPSPDGRMIEHPEFEQAYDLPKPCTAICLPLVVNGRVVGVLSVAGSANDRQFDERQHAPLRRSAQLLAHALYSQSQLWQMRQLNWLASKYPLERWKDSPQAPPEGALVPLARVLANIFLCPVVHVWMVSKRSGRPLTLQGYSWRGLFGQPPKSPVRHVLPTLAKAIPADHPNDSLAKPLLSFAWELAQQRQSKQGEAVEGRRASGLSFITAVYRDSEDRTQNYTWQAAQDGDLILRSDWLRPPLKQTSMPSYLQARRKIFTHEVLDQEGGKSASGWGLNAMMAFALWDQDDGAWSSTGPTQQHLGTLSFHTYQGEDAEHPSGQGWGAAWEPMVQHMQTYLPYVFRQVELVASPLNQMRSYFLHEGRRVLLEVSQQMQVASETVQTLVSEQSSWRRRLAQASLPLQQGHGLQGEQANELAGALAQGLHHLRTLQGQFDFKKGLSLVDEIDQLERVINQGIDAPGAMQHLGLGRDQHESLQPKWQKLAQLVDEGFQPYAPGLHRSLGTEPTLDSSLNGADIFVAPSLFRWLWGGLVLNTRKYLTPNSAIQVRLVRARWRSTDEGQSSASGFADGWALVLTNQASYDSEIDRWPELAGYGVFGSAGNALRAASLAKNREPRRTRHWVGQGLGLWAMRRVAPSLQMRLACRIEPMPQSPPQALYHFALCLPPQLIKRFGHFDDPSAVHPERFDV